MKHYQAIIVDDERLARQDMHHLLSEIKEISLVGEAANLDEAVRLIESHAPDLVFLDIQIRNENGFDLLDRVAHRFHIIFVTAFDEYAIHAFEINALDYLLKPVNPNRLKLSLEKLNKASNSTGKNFQKLKMKDPIFITVGEHSRFLNIGEISHICASGDYTEVFQIQNNKGLLVEKSLKEWEARLPAQFFVRIHRSTIVNISEIHSITTCANRTMQIRLKNTTRSLVVSRRYASKLKQQFA